MEARLDTPLFNAGLMPVNTINKQEVVDV